MHYHMQTRSRAAASDLALIADSFEVIQAPTASITTQLVVDTIQRREQIADSSLNQQKRKREDGDKGPQKRRRLDKGPSEQGQLSHDKVNHALSFNSVILEPSGMPPAWSERRTTIADCLPYFKSHQGALYSTLKVAKGFLIDAQVAVRDHFDSQVIITTPGGGLVQDISTGKMVRNKDQDRNYRIGSFEAIMGDPKSSLVVIAGAANPLFQVKAPHAYNVLDYFHVTDVWAENVHGLDKKFVKAYKIRLEKVDLNSRSWWTPRYANANDSGETEVGRYVCPIASCWACKKPSKVIYKQGWTCLDENCHQFFRFSGRDLTGFDPDRLEYTENFLRERTPFHGKDPEYPLQPSLPQMTEDDFGSEKVFKRGIVCPRCLCCSRRIHWDGWYCENPPCGFSYLLPLRKISREDFIARDNFKTTTKDEFFGEGIFHNKDVIDNHICTTWFLPNERPKGGFIGSVTRIRPMEAVLTRPGGIDELYTRFQEADLPLERRGARAAGSRIEELTSHFSANYGAPYKFGVVVDTTTGLRDAPPPIVETLLRLTWAGEASVAKSTQLIGENNLTVDSNAIPNKLEKFNELLALGYFEGSKISAHDDGEKELGPTVATLSLGSTSIMKFIPKKGKDIGTEKRNGKEKECILSVVLEHGDMIVMHGAQIQKCYLHEVVSHGIHRFALTCRHIRPETIRDVYQQERAKIDGQLSEEWAKIRYNGDKDRFESNLTGEAVDCPNSSGDGIKTQVQQNGSTETHLGDIEIQASPSTSKP
ncbi:hypothetical protein F4805DRAFT_477797 [Annulohypoxylon moriforme]|nr:hypothetical protein F4805DRAFT_477797 [Annulohypoxylon moriforme]